VVIVLPGPPRELHALWGPALETQPVRDLLGDSGAFAFFSMRLFGIPESELAESLRQIESEHDLSPLEITTCLRRGEIEIATVYEPPAAGVYDQFEAAIRERHADTLFSEDGSTVDEQVAALLSGPPLRTVAVAESCTGGLLAGRLTERPGSSEYVMGGLVVYSNAAKVALAGVEEELLERFGAVSPEVADALAFGAIERVGADVGIGVTGIAGPGGGSDEKPVGRVHVSVADRDGRKIARQLDLPGGRADVRDRTTTIALHLLRRLLRDEVDSPG
jgi:nicotinamide-nucleotide amidase